MYSDVSSWGVYGKYQMERTMASKPWLQHCAESNFCQQSQWFIIFFFVLTLLTIFASILCFFKLSGKGNATCLYCSVQLVTIGTLLLVVGSMMTYIAKKDKEAERNYTAQAVLRLEDKEFPDAARGVVELIELASE